MSDVSTPDDVLVHAQTLGVTWVHLAQVRHTLSLDVNSVPHRIGCPQANSAATVNLSLDEVITLIRQRDPHGCDCELLPESVATDNVLRQSSEPLLWLFDAYQQLECGQLLNAQRNLAHVALWEQGLTRATEFPDASMRAQLHARWAELVERLDAALQLPGTHRTERFAVLHALHVHTCITYHGALRRLSGIRIGPHQRVLMAITNLRARGLTPTPEDLLAALEADLIWAARIQDLGGLIHPRQRAQTLAALEQILSRTMTTPMATLACALTRPGAKTSVCVTARLGQPTLDHGIAALMLGLSPSGWVHGELDPRTSLADSKAVISRSVQELCSTPFYGRVTAVATVDAVPHCRIT